MKLTLDYRIKTVVSLVGIDLMASAVGLCTTILTISFISVKVLGSVSFYYSLYEIILSLFSFQVWQSIVFFSPEKESSIKSANTLELLSKIFAIFSWLIILIYTSLYDKDNIKIVILFSILNLFSYRSIALGQIRYYKDFKIQNFHRISTTSGRLFLVSLFYIFEYDSDLHLAMAWVIPELLGYMIYIIYSIKKGWRFRFFKIHKIFRNEFFKYSLNTYFQSTLDIPMKQLDIILLQTVSGNAAVGAYSLLKQMGQVISKLSSPIQQVYFVELKNLVNAGDISKALKTAQGRIFHTILLGIFVSLISVIVYREVLFYFDKGEFYINRTNVFVFVMAKFTFLSGILLGPFMQVSGSERINTRLISYTLLLFLCCSLLFVISKIQFYFYLTFLLVSIFSVSSRVIYLKSHVANS